MFIILYSFQHFSFQKEKLMPQLIPFSIRVQGFLFIELSSSSHLFSLFRFRQKCQIIFDIVEGIKVKPYVLFPMGNQYNSLLILSAQSCIFETFNVYLFHMSQASSHFLCISILKSLQKIVFLEKLLKGTLSMIVKYLMKLNKCLMLWTLALMWPMGMFVYEIYWLMSQFYK